MTDKLPGILQEIAGLVGEANAIAIASRAGGTRIYFPHKVHALHWLVECVGLEAAGKICAHFGGDSCDIPQAATGSFARFRRGIAQQVHQLDKAGKSSKEIARTVGVTQRLVHRHRLAHRGGKPDDPQGTLF